ncbi:MAG: LysM peptidoglycan-binding domain-containing protein, partial [Lutibacter sp.]
MKRIVLLFWLLLLSTVIFAQQKKYVSYTTKRGETIKSIAKKYHLSTKDLLRLNPGVRRKPKANTLIIVPNLSYSESVSSVEKNIENQPKDTEFYTVNPKETIFGISKKFGITINDLLQANPGLVYGLKVGMRLKIPENSKEITAPLAIDSTNFVIHTIKKDDTLFNLSKKYEVAEQEIIDLNPTLENGFQIGMVIKIKPKKKVNTFKEEIDFSKRLKVYFMLPYELQKLTDSISEKSFKKSNSLLSIATDFQMGALMAIDSLIKKGISIETHFFDTERSKQKLLLLLNTNNFNKTDLIIGPLFYENAFWVAQRVPSFVVAPFYSKNQYKLTKNNLIKTVADNDVLANKMLSYIEKNYSGENLVVISDTKPENQHNLWQSVNRLKQLDSLSNISVIKADKGMINPDQLTEKMVANKNNWVLLISNDKVTTAAAVNNLKVYNDSIPVRLFALKKESNFDKVDNNYLGKLNFTYPSENELMAFRNPQQKILFFNQFRRINFAFPSEYALRGFDVTYDLLLREAAYLPFEESLINGTSNRMNSDFYYINEKGVFENEMVKIIKINKDLELT